MTIKNRFIDYWTTSEYENYKYDLSIFEMLIYGCVGSMAAVMSILGILLTLPIWCAPYMLYKMHQIKEVKHE